MVVGPLVTRGFGLSGLFWFTAAMAILGIFIIALSVPKPAVQLQHRESGVAPAALSATLRNVALLRLDFGIFVLHALLMASFIALPLTLVEQGGLPKEEHWWVYLVAMFVGFFAMLPFIIYGFFVFVFGFFFCIFFFRGFFFFFLFGVGGGGGFAKGEFLGVFFGGFFGGFFSHGPFFFFG